MALTYPQFQGHMRVLSEDIKRMYGSVMNTEAYMFLRNRRDYVICFIENLDMSENRAEWVCECEAVKPQADPVAILSTLSSSFIRFDPDAGKDNKHGQMKLLTVEMRLLQHVLLSRIKFDAVLYLGASPGDHVGILMKAFPEIRWFAYDIKPLIPWPNLEIIPNDSFKFSRLMDLFGKKKRIVIINDIYNSSMAELYRISDEYYDEIAQYADIVYYMEKCFGNYKKPLLRVRIGADVWCQSFQTSASGEMRQVFSSRLGYESINFSTFNNRETMFRQEIRPKVYVNGRCYDCHYTDLVLKGMAAVTGVDLSVDTRRLHQRKLKLPMVWQILRKLKTKARLKANEADGVIISRKKWMYHYTERDDCNYSSLVFGKDLIRISNDIPMNQRLLSDYDAPEVMRKMGSIIVVNDDFLIKVPPYEIFQDGTLEVCINNSYEKEPLSSPPFCISCNINGVSFGPRLDHFGHMILSCGCVFAKTGVLRQEFFHVEPPDKLAGDAL